MYPPNTCICHSKAKEKLSLVFSILNLSPSAVVMLLLLSHTCPLFLYTDRSAKLIMKNSVVPNEVDGRRETFNVGCILFVNTLALIYQHVFFPIH